MKNNANIRSNLSVGKMHFKCCDVYSTTFGYCEWESARKTTMLECLHGISATPARARCQLPHLARVSLAAIAAVTTDAVSVIDKLIR